MLKPLVVTVILNTNRRDDTLACLESLARNSYENHRVIVLDNASTDGSVDEINRQFPAVRTVGLSRNAGYAGNNNVGISDAMLQGADWVLVLNEDTVLDPDCLTHLVSAAMSGKEVGIVGPMVYHFDEAETIQSAGGTLTPSWKARHIAQNELDSHQFSDPHRVDWVSGCAIMVRGSVIHQIGMLDERFFYYWEEVDWCLRAREHGWKILQVPEARLWHRGVQRDYRPKPSVDALSRTITRWFS